ncbi:hypothetical protein PORCRE_1804 [Porphyromonas crevioricanis JCM 15906]|uniref:Uncharacterized protein n=1 Tax=Porphyromonas crevioricanis JCM 15906 TaxID=1305617 RepID=T1CQF6_9PORP|nr:hypothetical protein PORCRE_1804 [Porphyromonas crevioricanis JCM 15906]
MFYYLVLRFFFGLVFLLKSGSLRSVFLLFFGLLRSCFWLTRERTKILSCERKLFLLC